MDNMYAWDARGVRLGLLAGRLVFGTLFAAHGCRKLFGWFRGYGLTGTGEFLQWLGFRPGRAFAAIAGLAELGSGLLILLGFLGPVGPALLLSVMSVAIITVHWATACSTHIAWAIAIHRTTRAAWPAAMVIATSCATSGSAAPENASQARRPLAGGATFI